MINIFASLFVLFINGYNKVCTKIMLFIYVNNDVAYINYVFINVN